MNNTGSGWPLVLSAEATVPSQTTQRPPQLALMNPTGEAFKIHEIRWSLKASTPRLTGSAVACKLDLGQVAVTNGFVPLWNFGRVISYDQDLGCEYSWRLQHPLYVPKGGTLMCDFQNRGQFSTPIDVRISYFATAIPDEQRMPSKVLLPYVSAYIGKPFNYTSADSDTSKENTLQNPFDVDLKISRLVGRINVNFAANTENYSIWGSHLLSTRVTLSNGDPLVRTATPFQQVFGDEGRAWEQRGTILKPKQYLQVFIDKAASTESGTEGSFIQPYVSLVGFYELMISGKVGTV